MGTSILVLSQPGTLVGESGLAPFARFLHVALRTMRWALWRWSIPLLAIARDVHALCGLDVIITSDVLGAAYPVDEFGSECSAAQLRETPCECYGGAARRAAAIGGDLTRANSSVTRTTHSASIGVDTGGYFYGSGTFYQRFNGTASAYLFGNSGYAARGLTHRDFAAGVTAEDPTGGAALAAELRQSLRFSTTGGQAAVRDPESSCRASSPECENPSRRSRQT